MGWPLYSKQGLNEGLDVMVCGSRLRYPDQGLGFRVCVSRLRYPGPSTIFADEIATVVKAGFRVPGLGFRVPVPYLRMRSSL